MVPKVHAFRTDNSTGEDVLPVLKPVTGREQYTVPGNPDHDGPGENRPYLWTGLNPRTIQFKQTRLHNFQGRKRAVRIVFSH